MAKIRCDIYRGEKHTVDSCVRDWFGQCVFAGDSYSTRIEPYSYVCVDLFCSIQGLSYGSLLHTFRQIHILPAKFTTKLYPSGNTLF